VVNGFQVLQHASTLLGSALLAAWLWRWLRRAPVRQLPPGLAPRPWTRLRVWLVLIALSAGWAALRSETLALPASVDDLRDTLRTTGMAAVQALALSSIGYAMLWKLLR
jgi:hypothetical protein